MMLENCFLRCLAVRVAIFSFVTTLMVPSALAQDVPNFQPPDLRQVCVATAVYDAPGGTQIGQLNPGDRVARQSLRFDGDGTLFYGFDYGAAMGVAEAAALPRSCEFALREAGAPRFKAPPNSCHLIVASRRTIGEVNTVAADYPAFAAQISAYSSDNGWYAVSLGLVRSDMAEIVLAAGEGLPEDAYCSDGVRFVAALKPEGLGRFGPGQWRDQDTATQATDAGALLAAWENTADTMSLAQACLLGSSVSCNRYAWELRAASETSAEAAATRLRFDLYGCMLGEEHSCTNALFVPQDDAMDPILAMLPAVERPADGAGLILPDLAATACDRNVVPACHALARPYMAKHDISAEEYMTLLEGTAKACLAGGDCQPFSAAVVEYHPVMGKSWVSDQLGIGRILFPYCTSEKAAPWGCALSVRYLRTFALDEGTDPLAADSAAGMIAEACANDSPEGCAYQSTLSAQFDQASRDAAAQKAQALCAAQEDPAAICADLVHVLASDLPAASGPLHAEYQRLAVLCRDTRATETDNPCTDAFHFYLTSISYQDLAKPLALLEETCSLGGKVTGCAPLGRYHEGKTYTLADGSDFRSVPAPDKAQVAWQIGCDGSFEGIESCSALGRSREVAKDYAAAGDAFGTGCDAAIASGNDPSGICYDAAKNARNVLQDYPNAERYFAAACYRFDEPFACKFLGLMRAQGEGMDINLASARELYQYACFYPTEVLRDEQACMLLGQLVVAEYDALTKDPARQPALDHGDMDEMETLTYASLALQIGCKGGYQGGYQASCSDSRALLDRWSKGAYPTRPATCTTIGNDHVMRAPQTCRVFRFYLTGDMGGHGPGAAATVFVWPDGQRTITLETADALYLNDHPATFDYSHEGWICYQNQSSGRSFCLHSS
ncbi:sel1 repeat family protein [Paracoccus caeni]|nr:sel1 repeat family protein [Paracoccus caeni]